MMLNLSLTVYIPRTDTQQRLRQACASGSPVGAFATIVNAAWFSCFHSELPSIRCEKEKIQTHSLGDWAFYFTFRFVKKGYFRFSQVWYCKCFSVLFA